MNSNVNLRTAIPISAKDFLVAQVMFRRGAY